MTSRLLSLPYEISSMIIAHLPIKDLLCWRQLCKTTRDTAANLFADNFRTFNVMFQRRALEALTGISVDPDLSGLVETLEISIYHLLPLDKLGALDRPYNPLERLPGRALPLEGSDSGEETDEILRSCRLAQLKEREYRKCLEEQEQMIRTGYDAQCLTQAMERLTNCRRIVISDFNRPWGLEKFKERIGVLPQRSLTFKSERSVSLVRHIVHATLSAAATSKLLVEELEIELGGLMENANRISPSMLSGPSIPILARYPLTHLRHLRLTVEGEVPGYESHFVRRTSDLVQFIGLFPALSSFGLEFESRDEHDFFSDFSTALFIPKLEVLELAMIDCTRKDMALFLLRHHKTLREISFESLHLTDCAEAWPWLIQIIRDSLHIASLSMRNCLIDDWEVFRSIRSKLALLEGSTWQDFTDIIELLSTSGDEDDT